MANTPGSARNKADKERSKQMSRPIQGRDSTKRRGQPSGPTKSTRRSTRNGPAQRSGARSQAKPAGRLSRRSPTALLTWGTVAVVLVIVVVLVVVKVTGGPGLASGTSWSPASAVVTNDIANVPASVFDKVGITSDAATIFPPIVISGQPPLTFSGSNGAKLPGVFFYGAEYCPHCAAERWALSIALSRFGTFHGLGNMTSSSTDEPPSIATITFRKATFTSTYIAFRSQEAFSDQPAPAGNGYEPLQRGTKQEDKLVSQYNSHTYFPSITPGYAAFPFIDFGNKVLSEENYSPSFLQGLSRDQIAAALREPTNAIGQAIVASANYLSAAICNIDHDQPGAVCTSRGVSAAARSLKLG
ncbi:MAG: DUF929 family protein [Acidimicrobiales bacterium]